MTARVARVAVMWTVALTMLLIAVPAFAQDEAETAAPAMGTSSILLEKMDWVLSDMMRCIEELRRIEDQDSKRLLVEQVEEILYREVEFPLLYQQADNADSLDVAPIGATSDVVDSGEANPLAPLYAEAFALTGITKGYEGYAAAAVDYIDRAKEIYRDVLSIQVPIDSFQGKQTLGQWMSDARGRWGATTAVRVNFYGKSVSQEVVDGLNLETVKLQGGVDPYHLEVAKADFLKGMRRYISTDDPLTHRRSDKFALYLPPGDYRIATGVSLEYGNQFTVHAAPNRNHYLIETLENGIAIYPVPNVRELGKTLDVSDDRGEAVPTGQGLEEDEAPSLMEQMEQDESLMQPEGSSTADEPVEEEPADDGGWEETEDWTSDEEPADAE